MARASRLLPACALAVGVCALLSCLEAPRAATAVGAAQHRLATSIAAILIQLTQAVLGLLPGIVVSLACVGIYFQKDRMSLKARAGFAGLLLACAVVATARLQQGSPAPAPAPGAAGGAAAGQAAREPQPVTGKIHSGEEVLMSDGRFVRLADPTKEEDSPLDETWRQSLAKSLVQAISSGEEQVVIMFTRIGCPWCDKQIPVLQDAIRKRAGMAPPAAMAGAAAAFVGGGGGPGSMLDAPLRVFVLEASEFPHLMEQFRVEAFPTTLVFGAPRVVPLMGKGYLDEETFEQICRAAATAEPEEEASEQPRRKRRGLFR